MRTKGYEWLNKCALLTVAFLVLAGLLALPIEATGADAAPPPVPTTTGNPEIPVKELQYLLKPLTKEDLVVEADGWQAVLKDHIAKISAKQIQAMQAEGTTKTQILEEVTKLQEQQTALIDRVNTVVNELRKKGGEIEAYEKYLAAVSGIKVDVTDAGSTWTVITGWLKSSEGGLRWLKNIILFIVTIVVFMILSAILGKATQRAVARARGASALLKDFLVNVVRKAIFLVGLVVALSMLEVNIGPFPGSHRSGWFHHRLCLARYPEQLRRRDHDFAVPALRYRQLRQRGRGQRNGVGHDPGVHHPDAAGQSNRCYSEQLDLGRHHHERHRKRNAPRRHGVRHRLRR